ncbi:MAG: CehA/McbA family metallohydrolase [Granulosicoccus sp.]
MKRNWLKGDWHLHSRHSNDSSNNPISRITAQAQRLGLDYLAITDHDVHVDGSVATHTWADPDFAASPVPIFHAAELTAPRGHLNVFKPEAYDHQRLFDARNERDWTLQALKTELGLHLSANHPRVRNDYGFSFDLADSFELWNGSGFAKNANGLKVWDNLLLSGRMLPGRGGSDAHHGPHPDMSRVQSVEALGNDVGTPTTWVHSVGPDLPSILAALEEGRASVSANPYAPRADLTAQVDGQPMRMGANHALPAQPVTITLQLTQALPAPYRVRIISNRTELVTLWTDPKTGTASFTDHPDSRRYYRAEIEGPQTPCPEIPYAPTQAGTMVALTNPLYFGYDPTF